MKRLASFAAASILLVSFAGCKPAKNSQGTSEFGKDREFFLGIRSLENGNQKEARTRLTKSLKKGSPLISRKSAETLCSIGDVQDKISAAKFLASRYKDEDALLTACRILYEHNEESQIILLTGNAPQDITYNETYSLRLRSMLKRKAQGFRSEASAWFTERPFTQWHYKFYCDLAEKNPQSENLENEWNRTLLCAGMRANVYKRDYKAALSELELLLPYYESGDFKLTPQIMSDIGKAHLYGSSDFRESAQFFQSEAEKYTETDGDMAFYCWFYAARLYDKCGNYQSKVAKCLNSAIQCTDNSQKKDNALWYLFKTSLNHSVENCLNIVYTKLPELGDPNYFDDFFDLLTPILLSERRYRELGKLYKNMKGHASRETTAKFAYIYARILEEQIWKPGENDLNGNTLEEEIRQALETAGNSGTDLYYKVMAAKKLQLSDEEKIRMLCSIRKDSEIETDPDLETLLNGYAFFGFPEKIYPEWNEAGQPLLSEKTTLNLCSLLQKCSGGKDDYYAQSLRIASRRANYAKEPLSRELLEFCFPQDYKDFVSTYSEKYGLPDSVLYALIRSESFFDSDVSSSAGAVGLCQLMSFTGEDIARRLRRSEFDLTDPETNIEFGAWYLGNLLSRLDGNYMDAFYAYNAGINRIRKWKQSSAYVLGIKILPEDLFLETIPYTETREYGRKLVSATSLYELLY